MTAGVLAAVSWSDGVGSGTMLLGGVALAAVVCGLAASVLPARRATRIAPATALADD